MTDSTISFDAAAELLAEAKALSPIEAEGAIHAAISADGVKIHDGKGGIFRWNDGPGKASRGNYVVNSEFNVFKQGDGWDGLDFSTKPQIQSPGNYANSRPGSLSKHYGLDETWKYDRANLAAAIKRLFGWDVDFVTRKHEIPETSSMGGAPEKYPWSQFELALAVELRDNGLPASKADAPTELVKWSADWFVKQVGKAPANSQIETHVRPVLNAVRIQLNL